MKRLYVLILSAVFCMALLARLSGQLAPPGSEPRVVSSAGASQEAYAASAGDEEATVLRRDPSGQFRIDGRINGADEKFLVDTGADALVLTEEAAEHAGIHVDPTTFEPMMQTASGTGKGIPVIVDQIEIAGHEFHDINAVVLEGLPVNLLGQSMLKRFPKIEMKGDSMVIGKE